MNESISPMDLETMTETQAIAVFWKLRKRFSWWARVICRPEVEETVGCSITDEEWEKLQDHAQLYEAFGLLDEVIETAIEDCIAR